MISPSDANFESFAGAGRVKPIQIGFPVELTGVWNATTGYPWKRLMLSGVAVANASPLQMTGTNAVPIDGNTALTSGTKGWLEPDPGAVGYLFITGETELTLTVEEADGSPSYTGISTLRFDQADGFVVTNPSAGVARVDFTGVTGSGASPRVAVWDGSTSLTSVSGFEFTGGDLFVPSDFTAAGTVYAGLVLATTTSAQQNVAYTSVALIRGGDDTAAAGTGYIGPSTLPYLSYLLLVDARTGGSLGQAGALAYTAGNTDDEAYFAAMPNQLSPTNYCSVVAFGKFGVVTNPGVSTTPTWGYTGTPGPGFTTHGGVVITGGSGSFVGTASANTFTNTNTFTSPGASDVPLTVKAAAAQTADLIQVLDSGGLTVLARVEADGEIEAASGAARLNSVLNDGQLALYNSAGASYATLTAGASDVLTTSGGFVVTTGGLTVTAGGATITAGGLTVSAGGANITGTVTATTFSGSGASLTTLNASNLSSGTVAAARLPIGTDVQAWGADLDALEALSGTNTIYYRSGANTWSAVTIGSGLSFSSGTLSSSVASGTVPNVLHNGGFEVWQRGTAFATAEDNYCADRWYVLSQSANVGVDKGTTNFAPLCSHVLTQTNASAQRAGVAHIVESRDTAPYAAAGRTVRFQFTARASTSTAIRFAILEWTGTADSVTSDVVNNWTSGTYTAGNFFLGSNLTVTAVGSGTATTTAADFSVSGTVSTSAKNLIVFIWSENTMAQNVALEVTKCGLYDGTTARDWLPWSFAEELGACQRQLWVMENRAVGIAQNTTQLYNRGAQTFPVTMRAAPSVSNATYTANAGSNGTPSVTTSVSGFSCTNSGSGWTTNALIDLAATFSAEL